MERVKVGGNGGSNGVIDLVSVDFTEIRSCDFNDNYSKADVGVSFFNFIK